ncbi:FAD linked oxidase domain protein [Leptothrix cholodnii SP-6]|uniref:FAD linked oxidase domain protein n=1 Tax=Leptothrix cholodnii (strain ATCC 51168 / LMG 8142 / SP-6) TaxID=395495 RepID=B1XWB7_LEPCP|nr:FAD-binding oxidoreductase [Leptothrix cholodnii]ACB33785.1 FAD linked oxidase domain protein [Leptothrix cholodnii SP-6]
MTAQAAALLAALRQCLGAEQVLCDGDLSAYEIDRRRRYHGRALAVLRPGSTDEVAQVLRLAAAHGVAVVTQGGNTGLVGGSVPDASGAQLLLSLQRLNRVRRLDAANLTLTVEAGCILQAAQEAAASADLLLPLSLAAEGSCTVGGNLATNAGGVQVLRYGNARELCLGLEVVTPHGEIWDGLRGLRKDNTGYDLRDLYIGSEGTLGVITAAVLRLYPQPRAVLTALATCATLEDCLNLLQRAQARSGATLTAFEVMNAQSLALVQQHFAAAALPSMPAAPWTVLLEVSDARNEQHAATLLESLLADAVAAGLIDDALVAQSLTQSRTFWRLRETIPLAQAADGLNIKHDIALPVSRIPAFVVQADAAVQAQCPGARSVNFGHLGDGNLHYNVMAPAGVAPAEFLVANEDAVNRRVYDLVNAHGGSISAEHGIGVLKRDELLRHQSPVALALMQRIKAALDPQGLMNPQRLL